MYSITFYVDLRNFDSTLFSLDEVEAFAKTKTTWIPTLTGGNLVKRHGDVFTLYGEDAINLKNLILDGSIFGVTFSEIPQLLNLNLTDGQVITISWNPSNIYRTELGLRYDDGEWQTASFIAPGVSQIGAQKIGTTLRVRARFVDTLGNHSPSYTVDEIQYEGTPEANTMWGLTNYETENNDFVGNATYTNMLEGTPSLFYKWIDYNRQFNIVTAWNPDDSMLYRLYHQQVIPYGDYVTKFEKINLNTLQTTNIPLTIPFNEENNLTMTPHSMVYRGSGVFLVSADNALLTLTSTGTMAELSDIGNQAGGMAIYLGTLYAGSIYSNTVLTIDPNTGVPSGSFNLTYDQPVWNVHGLIPNPNEGAPLLMVVEAQIPMTESGEYILAEVALDGTVTKLSTTFTSNNLNLVEISSIQTLVSVSDVYNLPEGIDPVSLYKNIDGVPSKVMSFGQIYFDYYAATAWNYDDNCLYHFATRTDSDSEVENPVLERLSLNTMQLTELSQTGYVYFPGYEVDMTGCSINDGGNDMYDGGNVMITDQSNTSAIQYTQTTVGDGTIESGTTWFGPGSTYFTNLYNGLFVLGAHNISIDRFGIYGNVGADGGGNTSSESFELTVNTVTYTAFFKKIWNAGDPSVNHLILVPATGGSLSQFASVNTDRDDHYVTGLSVVNRIYYLLFSRQSGGEVTPEVAQEVAQSFLEMVDPNNLATTLSNVNAGAADIVAHVPDSFTFNADSSGGTNYVGEIEGMNQIQSAVYFGDGVFITGGQGYLYRVTVSGTNANIEQMSYGDGFSMAGMAFVNEDLWGINQWGAWLIKIDPLTGAFLNEDIDQKFLPIITFNGNQPNNVFALGSANDTLYGLIEVDGTRIVVSIDTTTGIAMQVNELPEGSNIIGFTGVEG